MELPIKEGDKVKAEQLLARINPHDFQQRVNQEKAKYDYAVVTYQRYKTLLKSDTISRAAYDEKFAQLQVAKANLATATKSLNDTHLKAPFNGYIANRFVENFEYVRAKQNILSLQNLKEIEIIIHIPEQDVSNAQHIENFDVTQGTKQTIGTVVFAAFPEDTYSVDTKEFATEADPKTQTYRATLVMSLPENKIILPGMTASVKIKFGGTSDTDVFAIPISAVSIDPEGNHFVWLVNKEENAVSKQIIELGEATENNVQAIKGLKIDNRIVTAGVTHLTNGMKIRIIKGKIGKD